MLELVHVSLEDGEMAVMSCMALGKYIRMFATLNVIEKLKLELAFKIRLDNQINCVTTFLGLISHDSEKLHIYVKTV